MIDFSQFDRRPVIVAIAGPNGAGKSTFFHAHLENTGLRFVNSDVLAKELELDAYAAAELAASIRAALVQSGESFIFETVFSDPAGDKVQFLQKTQEAGYEVILCFIGINGPAMSDDRVAMRVSQGGHDVPAEKLVQRFPRILANLSRAVRLLPHVLIFDNSDLRTPFRHIATIEQGRTSHEAEHLPDWYSGLC